MVDLGTMGGVLSETGGLNQLGQVVGWVRFKDDTSHAFLYDGTMHDLGTLGGADSFARAINERGQVTGVSNGMDGVQRAFLYQDGVMKPLNAPGIPSEGRLINAGGDVSGFFDDPGNFIRSYFVGACQCLKDLGTLGGDQSYVFALNDAGQLAGASEVLSRRLHAFLYDNGAMKDLGTLGGDISQAFSMNESGWVTGFALTKAAETHAFVFDGTMMRDLGTLGGSVSEGTAINAAGQVVGFSSTANGEQHAVTWTAKDGLVDLNKVLRNAPHGLVLISGYAISDNGEIVAQANPGLVLLRPHTGAK
jgi:probable HAF family extracellular repeat protein